MEKNLLSPDEAADVLRCHPETVKRLCRQGALPAMKVGRQWRLNKLALDQVLNSGSIPATEPLPSKLHCIIRGLRAVQREQVDVEAVAKRLQKAIELAQEERIDFRMDLVDQREEAWMAAGRHPNPDDLPKRGMKVLYSDDLEDLVVAARLAVDLFPLAQSTRALRGAETEQERSKAISALFATLEAVESHWF